MKNTKFLIPGDKGITEYDLRAYELQVYAKRGYPNSRMRYRLLEKNLVLVELWLENLVKSKGVLGRAVSKLTARYHMRRVKVNDAMAWQKTGRAETWYWNGKPKEVFEFKTNAEGEVKAVYHVEYDEYGRLTELEDSARYDGTARIVKLSTNRPPAARESVSGAAGTTTRRPTTKASSPSPRTKMAYRWSTTATS